MKNKTRLFLITLFISLSASSCHKEPSIYIQNNSSKTVYYGLSYSYPDTSLNNIKDVPGKNGRTAYKINPGEQTELTASAFAFNPTMQLFIFDADVIEKNPWDSIVTHYMVLKRYQFTETDIQNSNWTITYP